ncbi:hypothetical protein [Desertibacillus haloalkaliphilus]|uniref:hypothetical protein n=1 Tax=Desertibacillus haloalkaliphilus TaxID=1328930 RepID=UPI001C252FE1|nr:hypothetical protein [Desertibacillus haloalkaliphilus]MBU8906723.1 hypothetical protein [Desertibacillus haloalkaliphilus]
MKYEDLAQIILLTQDAKNVGWEFSYEEEKLKAFDANFLHDSVEFNNESELYEWLEEQFNRAST